MTFTDARAYKNKIIVTTKNDKPVYAAYRNGFVMTKADKLTDLFSKVYGLIEDRRVFVYVTEKFIIDHKPLISPVDMLEFGIYSGRWCEYESKGLGYLSSDMDSYNDDVWMMVSGSDMLAKTSKDYDIKHDAVFSLWMEKYGESNWIDYKGVYDRQGSMAKSLFKCSVPEILPEIMETAAHQYNFDHVFELRQWWWYNDAGGAVEVNEKPGHFKFTQWCGIVEGKVVGLEYHDVAANPHMTKVVVNIMHREPLRATSTDDTDLDTYL